MSNTSTLIALADAIGSDPRWIATMGRDASADGTFYYSVKTTGVYCRPSCAARPARPENVQFHSTCEDARKAGFRPCKRCRPDLAGTASLATRFRAGGANTDIVFAIGECSLGALLVAQSHRGVCSILIGDDPALLVRDLQDRFPGANLIGDETGCQERVAKVVGLIEQPGIGVDLPLDVRGTAFQQRVWKALQQIPRGSTTTYSEIAARIGRPKAVRAVAQACGANALAVAIPCHRVIRSDGSLSGYRWGVERKRALLEKEAHGNRIEPAAQQ